MKKAEGKKFAEPEYETCVLCGKNTGVLRMTLVQNRADYVEGCGQLCPDCAKKIRSEQGRNVHKTRTT